MRKLPTIIVRMPVVAIGLALLCYLAGRLILVYQIRRARQMLEQVQKIKLGENENSLGLLLKRFGGYRWDVQLGAHEDYNYVLEGNPWRFPTLANYKTVAREHPIGMNWNASFRRAIGFRQWEISSEIAIKQQKVVAVQAEVNVEGKTMWLGTSWRLSEKPREFERDPAVDYLQWPPEPNLDFVTTGFLEMWNGGGSYWGFWVKPSSPTLKRQVASRWDFSCLESLRGCDSLCDFLPEAARFFFQHNELAPKGGGWDENSRACKHSPYEGRY